MNPYDGREPGVVDCSFYPAQHAAIEHKKNLERLANFDTLKAAAAADAAELQRLKDSWDKTPFGKIGELQAKIHAAELKAIDSREEYRKAWDFKSKHEAHRHPRPEIPTLPVEELKLHFPSHHRPAGPNFVPSK